jgi:TPR repeat protein
MKVAQMFEKGKGTMESDSRAYLWYRVCAQRGEKIALRKMGDYYLNGVVVNEDYNEAKYWYEKAIEKDDTLSMSSLAYILIANKAVSPNYQRADSLIQIPIQNNDALAQYVYAELLYNGYSVTQDKGKAMSYYKKSALNGCDLAKEMMALDNYNKDGNLLNILSLKKFTRGETYLILAKELNSGEKVKKDKKQALIYYKKAAMLNNKEAQDYLSCLPKTKAKKDKK